MNRTISIFFGLIVSLFGCQNSFAQIFQPATKPEFRFCSKNEFGVFIGMGSIEGSNDMPHPNKETVAEFSSSNGFQYGYLFIGAGIGVRKWDKDYVLPVFFSSSLNLWEAKNSLFLHLELGNQFISRKANSFGDKETGNFFVAYGLGYDFSVSKRIQLYLKTSVCHQKAIASGPSTGLGPYNGLESYNLRYLFLRVSLGLKWIK